LALPSSLGISALTMDEMPVSAAATRVNLDTLTPAEVAELCLYLLGDESAFVTGAEFVLDGGLTAQ
jgi:NAD(P)-dependent dehydrogenase (short-subunit alcohol dehydrogenase family)